jgi:hypothetical protein
MAPLSEINIDDYRSDPESFMLLYLHLNGCQSCAEFKPVVESMEEVFPEIEFREMQIHSLNELPLFAPPAMPSLILFVGGYRVNEFHGITNSRGQLKEVIKSWVL